MFHFLLVWCVFFCSVWCQNCFQENKMAAIFRLLISLIFCHHLLIYNVFALPMFNNLRGITSLLGKNDQTQQSVNLFDSNAGVQKAIVPIPPFGELMFSQNDQDGSLGIELNRGLDVLGYGANRRSKITVKDNTIIHEGIGSVKLAGDEIGLNEKFGVQMNGNDSVDYVRRYEVKIGNSFSNSLKAIVQQVMAILGKIVPSKL